MPRRPRRPPRISGDDDDVDAAPFAVDRDLQRIEEQLASPPELLAARPLRPVVVKPAELGVGPLPRAWFQRLDTCGVDTARFHRGLGCLLEGAVLDLQVRRRRLEALVQGTRRYLVSVDFLPPSALTHAVVAQVREIRASVPAGPARTARIGEAIVAGGPAVLPGPQQMVPSCTCPDGPFCKHFIAVVEGFGALLANEPQLLLVLWGFDAEEVTAAPTSIVVAPLAAGKQPLLGDLAQIFAIQLVQPDPAPQPSPALVAPAAPSRLESPAPASPSVRPPRAEVPDPAVIAPPERELAPLEIRREDLRALGLSPRTIDAWLREGVLLRTAHYGIYERTPEAERRLDESTPER